MTTPAEPTPEVRALEAARHLLRDAVQIASTPTDPWIVAKLPKGEEARSKARERAYDVDSLVRVAAAECATTGLNDWSCDYWRGRLRVSLDLFAEAMGRVPVEWPVVVS